MACGKKGCKCSEKEEKKEKLTVLKKKAKGIKKAVRTKK